ncbi:PASTA domain-containing protein [Sciscionella marina]|uniref:PASTA domain-containing protein n=1 Tax=Sciscionella marina TaxID=508770 RepID=UPI0012F628B1|nr:PASTA domain-containing protein [Sciscionella marina]
MSGELPDESVPDGPAAEVPDAVGFDAADACETVRTARLVPYGRDYTAAPAVGVVLKQTLAAGTDVTVGQAVSLHTEAGNLAPE